MPGWPWATSRTMPGVCATASVNCGPRASSWTPTPKGPATPRRRRTNSSGCEGEVADARRRLADVQEQAKRRPHDFAIIPYDGPNQTHRRPIYLECRADAVVLQPEGIVFRESDFAGSLGPGNPLASALRAVREYLADRGAFDPRGDGEPYPLLLVRPQGILTYYAAREAMQSWAADFGYELIEDDWKLQFPAPDPQLAKVVDRAIAQPRAELAAEAMLHRARPGRHRLVRGRWRRLRQPAGTAAGRAAAVDLAVLAEAAEVVQVGGGRPGTERAAAGAAVDLAPEPAVGRAATATADLAVQAEAAEAAASGGGGPALTMGGPGGSGFGTGTAAAPQGGSGWVDSAVQAEAAEGWKWRRPGTGPGRIPAAMVLAAESAAARPRQRQRRIWRIRWRQREWHAATDRRDRRKRFRHCGQRRHGGWRRPGVFRLQCG